MSLNTAVLGNRHNFPEPSRRWDSDRVNGHDNGSRPNRNFNNNLNDTTNSTMNENNRKRVRETSEPLVRRSYAKPRIMSAIVAVSGPSNEISNELGSNNRDSGNNLEKSVAQEIYQKPEAIKRNKRMFGALMGHLGMAKKKLEQDNDLIEKQDRLKVLAIEKHQIEAKRLAHIQRIKDREEKDTYLDKKDKEIAEMEKNDLLKISATWKSNIRPLEHFLTTSNDDVPILYWCPAKLDEITSKMLEKRKEIVQNLLIEREKLDNQKLIDIENELQDKLVKRREERDAFFARSNNYVATDSSADNHNNFEKEEEAYLVAAQDGEGEAVQGSSSNLENISNNKLLPLVGDYVDQEEDADDHNMTEDRAGEELLAALDG